MDFAAILDLEPHGPDVSVGLSPSYPWGGLYGGQIVAQALRAAAATVPDSHRPHSLHAYFIRRGDAAEPVRYEAERVRNGRSFVTRRVIARQAVGAILSLSASFQVDEAGPEAQTATAPGVPGPEGIEGDQWSEVFERRSVPVDEPGRAVAWFRMRDLSSDDPVTAACALAYLSDDLPTEAVIHQHPGRPGPDPWGSDWYSASLDHAIWFHRRAGAAPWQLHDFVCHGLMSSRGLSLGHVFTPDGAHVATIAQEVLLRGP